ncbi:MAG: choice-of-anchor D domain-containing protein [Gammaproteobacteria bacterium]|nr:choice-of-anchor D domain-containing protein [Gammaproteobacteria bacterium]MDH5801486.1 choice-of-anchor D domain-containing protein [Gammaproteobacteria bacterium]
MNRNVVLVGFKLLLVFSIVFLSACSSGDGVDIPKKAQIEITDSVSPENDLSIEFGSVTIGTTSEKSLLIRNSGNADLTLNPIDTTNLDAQFQIISDNCSGQVLSPTSSCSASIQFTPMSATSVSSGFDILSSDEDEGVITISVSGTGEPVPVPNIVVSDSIAPNDDLEMVFGNVTIDNATTATLTLTNEGAAALNIGAIASANPVSGSFSITVDNCSNQSLQPQAACTLTVQYLPQVQGLVADSFDIPSNDPDQPTIEFSVNGFGDPLPVPDIQITDTIAPNDDLSIVFGQVTAGQSVTETVTVRNIGLANLNLGAIGGSFALAFPFSISSDGCSNQALTPDASCTLSIRFAPDASGVFNSSFNIPSNDDDQPNVFFNVSGTGEPAPVANIAIRDTLLPNDDQQLTFGNVTANQTAVATVTISSTGTADLVLNSITTPAAPYSFSANNCPLQAMAPGTECTIEVVFAPTTTGVFNSSFMVNSNDPDAGDASITVFMSGTGDPVPVPGISISDNVGATGDSDLLFGNLLVNTAVIGTITVTSTGTADLVLGSVAGTNPLAAPYNVTSDTCSSASLAPTAQCHIMVSFAPTMVGTFNDSFNIPSNAGDITIDINGVGIAPDIEVTDSISPANDQQLPFGSLVVGTTGNSTVTVTNIGSADLVLGVVAGANPLAVPFSIVNDNCSSQTLAPGAACTVGARYSPVSAVASSDSFNIPSNAGDITVSISGTGLAPDISVTDSSGSSTDLQVPFGSQNIGTTITQSVTITNVGNANLNLGAIGVGNGLVAPFAFGNNNCSGTTLTAGTSCTIVLTFAPTNAQSYSDSFAIPSNDPDESNVTVRVTGTGVYPPTTMTVSPTSIAFPDTCVTAVRRTSVTLINTGAATLYAQAGVSGLDFSVSSNTCTTVAVGSSCALPVTFAPATTGIKSGTLTIVFNGGSRSVQLGGRGITGGTCGFPL